MENWVYYEYITAAGKSPYAKWSKTLSDHAKSRIEGRLNYVQALHNVEEPGWKPLKGNGKGLYSIRAKDQNGSQLRLIACFGDEVLGRKGDKRPVVFLGGTVKKGWSYKRTFIEKMQEHRKDFLENGRCRQYEDDEDDEEE